jgi:phosphohistidine phosphatase
MKELTLIRHAKSDWGNATLSDHDRPLNKRGLHAAPMMAGILGERGATPDAVLSSTALRAKTTAGIICADREIKLVPDIYLASLSTLMTVIRKIDESHRSAMLFGHNPGFEDLANRLLPGYLIDRLPTCGVVRMRLNINYWGEVDEFCGELIEFLYPKMFEA